MRKIISKHSGKKADKFQFILNELSDVGWIVFFFSRCVMRTRWKKQQPKWKHTSKMNRDQRSFGSWLWSTGVSIAIGYINVLTQSSDREKMPSCCTSKCNRCSALFFVSCFELFLSWFELRSVESYHWQMGKCMFFEHFFCALHQ